MSASKFISMVVALGIGAALSAESPPPVIIKVTDTEIWAQSCEDWDEWDKAGPAYRIHGNSYYVGTCGISAILITSDKGHVLIDSGTEKGAEIVLANIRSRGFDPEDIKLLLASHEHHDHVGGMARLQQDVRAPLALTDDAMKVMQSGKISPHDPQASIHPAMTPAARLISLKSKVARKTLRAFGITAIPTPGHSPGAMSYSWKSCEEGGCKTIVYADSLSAVSADEYRFTDHPKYVAAFRNSLDKLAAINPCDILLTPHPSASDMRARITSPVGLIGTQIGSGSCRELSASLMGRLSDRLEKEKH